MAQGTMTRERRRLQEQRKAQARVKRQNQIRQWAPIAAVTLVFLAGIAYITWLQIKPTITGTPHLVINQTEIDLGTQKYNTTVRASFQIRNDGDGTLTLNAPDRPTVVEGCCPNQVVVGQTRLNPGESTELYTDLMMHEGMGGKHLFEIVLNTNDKTQSSEKLTIKSDWVP